QKNPRMYGDDLATSSVAIALASKLRGMKEFDFTHAYAGNHIEFEALKNLRADDEYGDTGITISQRRNDLMAELKDQELAINIYSRQIYSKSADPVLKQQFLARMRSYGEQNALIWLIQAAK
ncbi:MAG: hypothetical protein JWO89_3181, partial [Verrucomicrobiaceae bacterium]|nr:hypothetical protein [Verrucomicrobiaceae bacterium]